MPAPVVAAIIGGSAAIGGTIYSSRQASRGQRQAQSAQNSAMDRDIAFQREQAAEDKRRYDEEIALMRSQHDAQQAEANRQAAEEQRRFEMQRADVERRQTNLAPYREAGAVSLKDLAAMASRPMAPSGVPGMSRDPYAVMDPSGMPSGGRPASTLHISDLDPRWKKGAAA
jgi:type II secretory pathway pseudopilin PulG